MLTFVCLFNPYLFSAFHVADTIPGYWDTSINKTMFSVLMELTLYWDKVNNNKYNKLCLQR